MSGLPRGWENAKLYEAVSCIKGKKPNKLSDEGQSGLIPYIDIKAFEKNEIRQYADVDSSKIAEKDNILVVWDGARSGLVGIGQEGAIGSTIVALKPIFINSLYLYRFLQTQYNYINSNHKGTGIPHVDPDIFWNIELPTAPMNEQQRIIMKLEKLLNKVDTCNERLDRIPYILKRFRQSVLAATCSGRLTADWRERHDDGIQAVNEIIKALKGKRLKNATMSTQKTRINEIFSYNEEGDNGELPDGWMYTALNKLCDSFQYGTSTKSEKEGKVPVLRMGNIQNRKIDWDDLVYTSDEEEIEKYILKPGDVLFNRTNSPELVGKTAIYRGERPAIFAGYLIKITNHQELDSEYLNYCLNSTYAREFCLKVKTDGVSQSNINAQKLGKFEVPFCSIEEQKEIVRRVNALFLIADQIEQRYNKAKAYADKLTQSILAKAFRGELVSQDPNDEPASVLLERIKAEKVKIERQKYAKTRKSS